MISVPDWAVALVRTSAPTLQLRQRTIQAARQFPPDALRKAVGDAYTELFAEALPHVVRVWNVLPGITDLLGDEERYMIFNAGRHDAFSRHFADFPENLPAASGVGALTGDALSIHLLSSTLPGAAVNNPRQVPAYRYSKRYGQMPPCFARATRWGNHLFLSGTAAILGEDTQREQDPTAQLDITQHNLTAITPPPYRITHLRAYVPSAHHLEWARQALATRYPGAAVEVVHAGLCRKNLLIEIEGLATAFK